MVIGQNVSKEPNGTTDATASMEAGNPQTRGETYWLSAASFVLGISPWAITSAACSIRWRSTSGSSSYFEVGCGSKAQSARVSATKSSRPRATAWEKRRDGRVEYVPQGSWSTLAQEQPSCWAAGSVEEQSFRRPRCHTRAGDRLYGLCALELV